MELSKAPNSRKLQPCRTWFMAGFANLHLVWPINLYILRIRNLPKLYLRKNAAHTLDSKSALFSARRSSHSSPSHCLPAAVLILMIPLGMHFCSYCSRLATQSSSIKQALIMNKWLKMDSNIILHRFSPA
ncbi:uncharacterized protein LOC135431773 [Drosophila montana]|uniref:uncharacterized protein LOC135431773 n=1 Tax=Drosophila montana TaxID=40370 RepID=UPI00313BFDC6